MFYIGLYREIMKTSSRLKPVPGYLSILAEMILIWSFLIMVQMVQVCCIFRSHKLKIDFQIIFLNLLV